MAATLCEGCDGPGLGSEGQSDLREAPPTCPQGPFPGRVRPGCPWVLATRMRLAGRAPLALLRDSLGAGTGGCPGWWQGPHRPLQERKWAGGGHALGPCTGHWDAWASYRVQPFPWPGRAASFPAAPALRPPAPALHGTCSSARSSGWQPRRAVQPGSGEDDCGCQVPGWDRHLAGVQ